ncbi:hypothetical protein, partial [Nitrosococcus oceani]|uniref:hypothetical protein n=1 Tax=Nitrosococcus oceani TaxID=1229 RepID=UPI001E410ECF
LSLGGHSTSMFNSKERFIMLKPSPILQPDNIPMVDNLLHTRLMGFKKSSKLKGQRNAVNDQLKNIS